MLSNIKEYSKLICISLVIGGISCKKLVNVPEPINTITTSETFSSEANANSAIVAIYNDLNNVNLSYGNGDMTIFCGLSADELNYFGAASDDAYYFQSNTLLADNGSVNAILWSAPYYDIYMANAAIEALPGSTNIPIASRNQFKGEAKFLRAFVYFYLVNLFGDVPLVTSTAWAHSDTISRAPAATIYQQIVADLKDAQSLLVSDYSWSGGERIRANKAAATALLARVYLYMKQWADAETQASDVINDADYGLTDLNSIFLKNSNEAILQWQVSDQNYPYATREGFSMITPDQASNPLYYMTDSLLAAFEPNDARKISWIDSTITDRTYYYPYKYKILTGNQGDVQEYYMVLRLAEQFLIRAEARAQQNKLSDAVSDLNVIRERASLSDLPTSLSQPETLNAVAQERRIELFAEWGHRWLDLKRTNQANVVLPVTKPQWAVGQQLYPIPKNERQLDPNLTQNAGYN